MINDGMFEQWVTGTSGARTEVTQTWYDKTHLPLSLPSGFTQENTRKRVTSVTYEENFNANPEIFDHATHYTYDIHGNVNTLIQDYPEMGAIVPDQRHKRIDYDYDLISGNVHQVSYQAGQPDQFYHRYTYDADNRIVDVFTSTYGWDGGGVIAGNTTMPEDVPFWENDATYRYYLHGPLARVELGDINVQGIDYVYTLQGWIKGVNSGSLDETREIGKDGANGSLNQFFAQDAFGYNLGYYIGDYQPIDPLWNSVTSQFDAYIPGSDLANTRKDLWNGNIGWMVTGLFAPPGSDGGGSTGADLIQGMAYQYDQLNRLRNSVGFDDFLQINNQFANSPTANRYRNDFVYDANGNIRHQTKYDESGQMFENFGYNYKYNDDLELTQNRLYHTLEDPSLDGLMPDDIDSMGPFTSGQDVINTSNNYSYDQLGQLKRDNSEKIESIVWRVDGKIKRVNRMNGNPTMKELEFSYDVTGQRVSKKVLSDLGVWEETTYYIRDAQGNVMAVYKHTQPGGTPELRLEEMHIYGSSRLGMTSIRNNEMITAANPTDDGVFTRTIGETRYELSNHLGNVLSVITDIKIARATGANLDYYEAQVLSYTDYYPFGSPMDNANNAVTDRNWSGGYRFGFNGHEKDDEITGSGNHLSFGDYGYDPRTGRRWRPDPKSTLLPHITPYVFGLNNPIITIDEDGQFPILINGNTSGGDHERASPTYWNKNILSTISNRTGYKMGASFNGSNASNSRFSGDFFFVDGNKGWGAGTRRTAGVAQAKVDAQAVWNKMKETMKDGTVTEQLQVVTHSRGSAYGEGYMAQMTVEIQKLAEKEGIGFAYDKNSIVEYSVNLAPHQSNSINYGNNGAKNVNISHIGDPFSGDDATGNVVNVQSIPEVDDGPIDQHGTGSFVTELNAVLKTLESGVTKSGLFKAIKNVYQNYDKNRTNGDKSTVTQGGN